MLSLLKELKMLSEEFIKDDAYRLACESRIDDDNRTAVGQVTYSHIRK